MRPRSCLPKHPQADFLFLSAPTKMGEADQESSSSALDSPPEATSERRKTAGLFPSQSGNKPEQISVFGAPLSPAPSDSLVLVSRQG